MLNILEMNISALDLMEQTQLHAKAQTDPNTTSMGDFSSTLLPIDRLSRKKEIKINKAQQKQMALYIS